MSINQNGSNFLNNSSINSMCNTTKNNSEVNFPELLSTQNAVYVQELYQRFLSGDTSINSSWQNFFRELNDTPQSIIEDFLGKEWFSKTSQIIGNENFIDSGLTELYKQEDNRNKLVKQKISRSNSTDAINITNNKQVVSQADSQLTDLKNAILLYELKKHYRSKGYLSAKLDPLSFTYKSISTRQLMSSSVNNQLTSKLTSSKSSNLTDKVSTEYPNVNSTKHPNVNSVTDLHNFYSSKYCGYISYEFSHISEDKECEWLYNFVETQNIVSNNQLRKQALKLVMQGEMFEDFLHKRFPGTKRFSIEGVTSGLSAITHIIEQSSQYGCEYIDIGMAHRGRLNVLVNIMQQPESQIFAKFAGLSVLTEDPNLIVSGDVKYHMGHSTKYLINSSSTNVSDNSTLTDKSIHLSLAFNPSHLEAVNSVVMGKTKARQDKYNNMRTSNSASVTDAVSGASVADAVSGVSVADAVSGASATDAVSGASVGVNQAEINPQDKAISLLIHGDAAVMGQGCVSECLNMGTVDGYNVGGVIHIIFDNQVGFTANPNESRGMKFASSIFKMIEAPIIHVNADRVDEVIFAAQLATAYRYRFHKDIVINLVGYRRYGHNEADEPKFSQPALYSKIIKHPRVDSIYADQLIDEQIISQSDYDNMQQEIKSHLEAEFKIRNDVKTGDISIFEDNWQHLEMDSPELLNEDPETGVDISKLHHLVKKLTSLPEKFTPHPRLAKSLVDKLKMVESDNMIDWSLGEALAYASLIDEQYSVRLSGQDACRGTFSHRHSVLHHTISSTNPDDITKNSGRTFIPLCHINDNTNSFSGVTTTDDLDAVSKDGLSVKSGNYHVINSVLSENAVLGFEYGYSNVNPNNLVIWEAQFGDFANGAQVIIDQFISSAQVKWLRMSGLVMLLPHGYEGQGPEHSSARLERYLQSCAENNMIVTYPTSAANIFHLLRRQIINKIRKPLIVMSPKSLLRHKSVFSPISDISSNTSFSRVFQDIDITSDNQSVSSVKQIILCAGKIFFDLYDYKSKNNVTNVAIVRLEQLYPLPEQEICRILGQFNKRAKLIWVQEEPRNMGAWSFIREHFDINPSIKVKLNNRAIIYVGRDSAASTATGFASTHHTEQTTLITEAFKQ